MGKAFEENEFTHNLGLDPEVFELFFISGKMKNFLQNYRAYTLPANKKAGRNDSDPLSIKLLTEVISRARPEPSVLCPAGSRLLHQDPSGR